MTEHVHTYGQLKGFRHLHWDFPLVKMTFFSKR